MTRGMWRWWGRFELAWVGVLTGGLRSLLTILGVAVGVAAVMTLLAAGQGAKAVVAAQYQHLGTNVITVQANSSAVVMRARLASELARQVPDIVAAMPLAPLKLSVNWRQVRGSRPEVLGVTDQLPRIHALRVTEGRFISGLENTRALRVAVLGATAARGLFGGLDPVGQTIDVGATPFQVIGVLAPQRTAPTLQGVPLASVGAATAKPASRGSSSNARPKAAKKSALRASASTGGGLNNSVLIPVRTAQRLAVSPSVGAIWIKVQTRAAVGSVVAQLQRLLALRFGSRGAPQGNHGGHVLVLGKSHGHAPFSVTSLDALVQQAGATSRTLSLLLGAIAGISLLIAGIGVMNVMLVAVRERTVEIGLRKAIGATAEDLLAQFLLESLLLCGSGGLIGWLGGYGGIALFSALGIASQAVPGEAVLAVGVAAGLGVLFGTYPAFLASELEPVDALRRP